MSVPSGALRHPLGTADGGAVHGRPANLDGVRDRGPRAYRCLRAATRGGRMSGPIVIIGAGQAGGRAAEALHSAGYAGSITLVGEETHPPYERPELSKEFLRDGSLERIS